MRKATIRFVMSVRSSAWNNSAPTGRIFMKFDIWGFFENLPKKNHVSLKSDRNKGTLHEDQCTFFIVSRSFLLRVRNISDKSSRENQNTHFVFSNFFFFRKSYRLWDNVDKYCSAGQTTDYKMAHAHCMLYNKGYRHALRIWNTHCFSTATMVALTCLNVTLQYIVCLICNVANRYYLSWSGPRVHQVADRWHRAQCDHALVRWQESTDGEVLIIPVNEVADLWNSVVILALTLYFTPKAGPTRA